MHIGCPTSSTERLQRIFGAVHGSRKPYTSHDDVRVVFRGPRAEPQCIAAAVAAPSALVKLTGAHTHDTNHSVRVPTSSTILSGLRFVARIKRQRVAQLRHNLHDGGQQSVRRTERVYYG